MRLLCLVFLVIIQNCTNGHPSIETNNDNQRKITEKDNDDSKQIIGSSVVTSVSVFLNGDEPQFSDAVGHRLPKPQEPLQVASPINLLNPDRYEFYTFDSTGQLVKRIMTLKEIHSIVANGDGEGSTIIHNSAMNDRDPEKNVQDIVTSVQNVLTKEVEWKNNASNPNNHMLDTPDVSSSWSMILPAIFGNTGGDIFPHSRPQQVVMTPDSDVVEHSTNSNLRKPTRYSSSSTTTTTKRRPIPTRTSTVVHLVDNNDLLMTTELSQPHKIFMNNKEMIKPLFNRNDVKSDYGEEHTTVKIKTTLPTKTTTTTTTTTAKTTKKSSTKRPHKNKPNKFTTVHDHPEVTTKRGTNKRKPTTGPIVGTTTKRVSTHHTRRPGQSTTSGKHTTKRVHTTKKNKPISTTNGPVLTTTYGYPTYPTITTTSTPTTKKNKRKHPTGAPSKGETLSPIDKVTLKHKKRTTTISPPTSTPSIHTTQKVHKRKHTTKYPLSTSTHHTTNHHTSIHHNSNYHTANDHTSIHHISNHHTTNHHNSNHHTTNHNSNGHNSNHHTSNDHPSYHHHPSTTHYTTSTTPQTTTKHYTTTTPKPTTKTTTKHHTTTTTPYTTTKHYTTTTPHTTTKYTTVSTTKKHTTPKSTTTSTTPYTTTKHYHTKTPHTTHHTTTKHYTTTKGPTTTTTTTTTTVKPQTSKKPHEKPYLTIKPHSTSKPITTSSPPITTSTHHPTPITTKHPKTKHPSNKIFVTTDNDSIDGQGSATTIVFNNLSQQDDINTKLSFDQIMESLKDKNDNDQPSTSTEDEQKIVPTKQPVLYSNNNVIKSSEKIQSQTESVEDPTTITTFITEKFDSSVLTTQKPLSERISLEGANVVKFEPLYAELLEPILTQLTTEIPDTTDELTESQTDMMTTTNESSNESLINISDEIPATKRYEELNIDTKQINSVKTSSSSSSSSSEESNDKNTSELTQRIEEFIANNMQNNEKVFVKVQNPQTIYFNQPSEMNMNELQKESATLASMLEHNIKQTTIKPNNNKLHNDTADNEIENLLSDVYNQITDAPLLTTKMPIITTFNDDLKLKQNIESSNRFTNIAQMSNSILVPPSKDITPQLNSNDKFDMMETLALQLNEEMKKNNQIQDDLNNEKNIPIIIDAVTDPVTDNNNLASDEENYSTISNLMNLNTNAIEYQTTTTTAATTSSETATTILPPGNNVDYSTEKIDDEENVMENVDDENLSAQFFSTELLDNIEDTTNIKEIESMIETTEQPKIFLKTTEIPLNMNENVNDQEEEISTEINGKISISSNEQQNFKNENSLDDDIVVQSTTIEIDSNEKYGDSSTEIFNENSSEKSTEKSTEKYIIITNDSTSLESQENIESTTLDSDEVQSLNSNEESTESTMELVELIPQPPTQKPKIQVNVVPTQDSNIFNITEKEQIYVKLGESMNNSANIENSTLQPIDFSTIKLTILPSVTMPPKKKSTLKPVHYFKQPVFQNEQKIIGFNGNQQRPVIRPAALTNLKITKITTATRSPVKLEPSPDKSLGLEASTMDLQEDVQEFSRLCNELAFSYWRSITAEKISNARSLVISPFALTSMLSMVFLGARGGTSGEMNEILRLDDMVTFNPHLIFKNITESVENAKDSDIASSAFVREIFSDRSNGKILPFFKDKTQQFYAGHVEEVNFNVVNDIIRRRTNLLVKRHTMGKVMEYLRTNSVWVNGPLSTVSANLFQTDCSRGSVTDRDGEMFFQVHPSIRQRRLVPIPAIVFRSGFTAGYDTELDATAVAFGSTDETVSTIYVMPGQHGLANPGDNLERLENNIMENGISKNTWSHLLGSLMQRPGLEVQLPRFSHRSFVNASIGLQKLGLKALFDSDSADLRGLTGSSNKDVYISDMIQINTFSTCGEEKIGDHHHVEMYPAPPLRKRNSDIGDNDSDLMNIDQMNVSSGSIEHDSARGFYDDLLDPKYLELPLPLRPRQARIPDAPRLRFDKPFLYFVRHNPSGMILFMGRFNPRLLP